MTKKQFKEKCERLEKAGWTLVEYEPENKYAKYTRNLYAKYTRNLSTAIVGKQK